MSSETGPRAAVYGALAAAAVLVVAAPTPAASLSALAHPGTAAQVTDPLVALLALLAWLCAAYLLAVAALTLGSRLPGLVGTALGAVARRAAPAALRRALEVALGVTLAVGTLGGTALAADLPAAPPAASGTVSALPSPSLDQPVASPTPSLDHPVTSPAPAAAAPDLDWPGSARPAVARPATEPAAEQVVVRPGDSLWSIAQERLEQQTGGEVSDAQVAQAWPSWWQANREAVGDDPDVLRPGTPLAPPTDS